MDLQPEPTEPDINFREEREVLMYIQYYTRDGKSDITT
jgi:hypothetical protein